MCRILTQLIDSGTISSHDDAIEACSAPAVTMPGMGSSKFEPNDRGKNADFGISLSSHFAKNILIHSEIKIKHTVPDGTYSVNRVSIILIPSLPTDSPLLLIEDIHKSYQLGRESLPVLQGLSLSLAAGEILIIMGPSGSGKTTLLNCISGIDTPDGGRIVIDGRTVDFSSQHELTLMRRRDIGMVFQFFNLIPTLTVRENIALPFLIDRKKPGVSERRVTDMLARIGLAHRENHYPFQLSGGEMQLTSIARALVHRPGLLLADEPTGNVSPRIARSIMEILCDTVKGSGTSFVMVTHSPEHAAWANRIAFLREGRIIDELNHDGDPHNVSPIYDRLLELEI